MMALDKSKVTKADVQRIRSLGFDLSVNNFVYSMRAAAREIAMLRAARRIDQRERLLFAAIGAVGGAIVTFISMVVLT